MRASPARQPLAAGARRLVDEQGVRQPAARRMRPAAVAISGSSQLGVMVPESCSGSCPSTAHHLPLHRRERHGSVDHVNALRLAPRQLEIRRAHPLEERLGLGLEAVRGTGPGGCARARGPTGTGRSSSSVQSGCRPPCTWRGQGFDPCRDRPRGRLPDTREWHP